MKVFAIASIPQGVTIEEIQQLLPKEVPATLYGTSRSVKNSPSITAHSARQPCGGSLCGNITLPIRYEWIERCTTFLRNKHIRDFFMPITIASIMNLMGPDMMVILLIVLLLFGAQKLPELARGMGQAVKEFSAPQDEIERELLQRQGRL